MPKRDPDLLVQDMLEAMQKIEIYIAGLDYPKFLRDEKTTDAVVRNLEVLGEAARQLPDDFTLRNPDVPWNQIAGLRNRIVHDYFGLTTDHSSARAGGPRNACGGQISGAAAYR